MTETTTTRLQRLIQERLNDVTLAEYVAAGRTAGLSWRTLANEIEAATRIEVSHTMLRRWFGQTATEPATDSPGTPGAGGRGKEALVPAGDGQRGIRLPSTRPHPDQATDEPAS
jgi:hypothetical protein